MAKKRRTAKTAPAVRRIAGDELRLISQRDLRALMEQCTTYEAKAASTMGSSRELVGDYVKNKNLHPTAFSMAKRLVRLGRRDPGKLWMLLAHLDDYREKLGLDRLAKEQGQLLPSGADDEKVVRMPREVPESAGDAA